MLLLTGVALLVMSEIIPSSNGFTCYKCSYASETGSGQRGCIENPDTLGMGARLECNATSFCVLQEQYDIHKDTVTSYFRSCSGTTWGNECHKDWSHVTCRASCQGNYCNHRDNGERYKEYLASYKDDGPNDNGNQITGWLTIFVCFARIVYMTLSEIG